MASIRKFLPVLQNVTKSKPSLDFASVFNHRFIFRSYDKKGLDHHQNPENVSNLDKGSKQVGTGSVGAPACDDVMRLKIEDNDGNGLQIEIDDVGKVTIAKLKTIGSGSAIASSSLATKGVKGKHVDDETNKSRSFLLAEGGFKATINDYKTKKELIKDDPKKDK